MEASAATFYLWMRAPGGDDVGFVESLLKLGLVTTPGSFLGPGGEGYVRWALVPTLERIERLGHVRNWRKLAATSPSFEEDVLRVCKLLLDGDTRIGKLPDRLKAKQKRVSRAAPAAKPAKQGAARATPKAASKAKPAARKTSKKQR